jgi:hypothetical protein
MSKCVIVDLSKLKIKISELEKTTDINFEK